MSGFVSNIQDRFHAAEGRYDDSRRYPAMECPSYEDATNPANQRRIPPTTGELKPYLGLQARLSQVWFNRWTLLLFLVMVRVLLATQSLDSDLDSARDKALSACSSVESMGSAMASMPHYMSKGVNEIAAKGIETAVQALEATLLMMITAIQEIVIFIINIVTSTYLCLITFAIKGSVGLVVDATKEITDFINKATREISDGITKEMGSLQNGINKALSAIESVPAFFGGKLDIPDVKLPSADKLKSGLQIPTTFLKKMEDFENSLPDFKSVQKAANDVIRIPFQKIHSTVNETLGVYSFDRSVFPVPEKERLTFCSDDPMINNFFNKLVKVVITVKWALIGVLIALALIAIAPMAYREIQKWRITRERAYVLTDPARDFDPIDIVMIASRPHTSNFGLKLASRFRTKRQQHLVRWAVAYVTTPAALFVLALGIAGLAGVLCQYIMLKQVESRAPALAAEVGEFAGIVVEKLNAASTAWGDNTNRAIAATNDDLNKDVFGWVKEGTDTLNTTLNTLVDKMTEGIDDLLGDSPLKGPVKDVLDCLVVFKVQGIQKGITWVHEHAHVTLPLLPVDTFSIGAASSLSSGSGSDSFLSNPGAKATDEITDVVVKLTDKWEKMLFQEAIISGCVTGIWLICLIIALVRTAILFNRADKARGEGGVAPMGGFVPRGPHANAQVQMHQTMYDVDLGDSWGMNKERNGSQSSSSRDSSSCSSSSSSSSTSSPSRSGSTGHARDAGPFTDMFGNTSPGDVPKTPSDRSYVPKREVGRVRVGEVKGGLTRNSLETSRNRESVYPWVADVKR